MERTIPTHTLEKFSTFGDLLRFLRRRAGITQMELSIAVGYSDAQISRLEQNLRLPDIPTIEARFVFALGLESEPQAVARLLELAANIRREDAPALGLCPYKGLNYFDEADADLFVGREVLSNKLVERVLSLASNNSSDNLHFLAVVGASGSGKSSVVRAGVIPALRWNKESSGWHIRIITPTAHPLESLAATLTQGSMSVTATATLMDDLANEHRSLYLFAKRDLLNEKGSSLLLVVDQFEELFALCHSEPERSAFIGNLLTAACEADSPVMVLITLRADFYTHCAHYIQLREALAQHQEYIGAMTTAELRYAIEEPASRGRWELEPGLVDLLLHDVGNEPGALPLLSHALLETWQRRRGRLLTLSGYASSGGVRGAIAETAEAVFSDQFTREQQSIARHIFLRLTELSEETSTADTRRRATFNELILKPEETAETQYVLKALADARLIMTSEDSAEVAHEALIREWPTLRSWLEENREGLRLHRHLTEAAQDWSSMNREIDLLYRGVRLAQAREWAGEHLDDLNILEREFLDASVEQSEREIKEREEHRQRELESAQKLAQAEQQRATELDIINSVREGLASKLDFDSIVELVGNKIHEIFNAQCVISLYDPVTRMISVPFYWVEGQRISEKPFPLGKGITSVIIETRQPLRLSTSDEILAYGAIPPQGFDVGKSYLGVPLVAGNNEVLGAIAIHDRVHEQAFSEGDEHLLSTLANSMSVALENARLFHETQRLLKETKQRASQLRGRALYLAGAFMIALVMAFTALFFGGKARQSAVDAQNAERIASSRELAAAAIRSLEEDPERSILLALQAESTVDTIEAQNALHNSILVSRIVLVLHHDNSVWSVIFSPDGKRIATASQDKTAKIWDATTGQLLLTLTGHTDSVNNISYSPDGKLIATASDDHTAKVWDAITGKELLTLTGHADAVWRIAFSPDGTRLATASVDSTAKVWDVFTGRELQTFSGHENAVTDIAFNPDEKRIATSGGDGNVRIWDASSGKELLTLSAGGEQLRGVAFSPDGARVAVTSNGNDFVKVWDATTGEELLSGNMGDTDWLRDITFSRDGKLAATGGNSQKVNVWDSTTGQVLYTLSGHTSSVNGVAFSPDGTRLATAGWDHTARVWDITPAKEALFIPFANTATSGWSRWLHYSPDGKHILTDYTDSNARIWDAVTGKELVQFSNHDTNAWISSYSHDGKLAATGNEDGTVIIWEAQTGKKLTTLVGHQEGITQIDFSPDGTRLASSSWDHTAIIFDVASGKELLTLHFNDDLCGHNQSATTLAYSPDGKQIVTGCGSGESAILDATGEKLFDVSLPTGVDGESVNGSAYSPDGKLVAVAGKLGTIRIWDALTGKQLLNLRGHTGAVHQITFSPDGKLLASASNDGTARLWDTTSGVNLLTLPADSYGAGGVSFHPDGTRLAVGSHSGISIFILPIEDVIQLAKSRVTRELTLEECQKYLHMEQCPSNP